MKNQYIYTFMLLLFAFSCTHKDVDIYSVKIDFSIDSKLKNSVNSKLYVVEKSDKIFYYYSDTLDYQHNYISKIEYSKPDKNMLLDNIVCSSIGEKSFLVDGEEIKVKRFYYDIEDVEDEEYVFFFNDKYGIFLKHSFQWRTSVTYYRENNKSNALIDKIISDSFLNYP